MDNQLLIVAQVIVKGFVEANKRLPQTKEEWEEIKMGVLKTWKASYLADQEIKKLK